MSYTDTPALDRLQAAVDEGDLETARRTLLTLGPDDQRLLADEMGLEAFERARGAAARGRRRAKLGKVIVLPGIMGSELDVVDRTGDVDRVWLNFLRLVVGRIEDLELAPDGSPAKPGLHVRAAGLHRKTYVPLLMELDNRWHVRPFPFDWREDIDSSAARLDGEVKAFGAGNPVHLVAHSMGGLVSRRFIQRYRDTWDSMDDPSRLGRGGRLVMLGTPNRGSYAIPLTLTGAEKVVQMLAKADLKHDLNKLLAIIGSFPGAYQMLPSASVDLGDDHIQLFNVRSWGAIPVQESFLTRGRTFLEQLDEVIDASRLLYVAGVNQETPFGIRIDGPGRFSYRQTLDGDGRVAHRLGLLDGVTTYWLDAIHGDLAKDSRVLDSITDLLQHGATTLLPTAKPAAPPTRRARRGWIPGDELAPVPPAIDTILADARGGTRDGEPGLTRAQAVLLENLTLAEYLGSGGRPETKPPAGEPTPPNRPLTMSVEVVWGDVTKVDAHVYAVGHYQGVLPQYAELALDKVVSGIDPGNDDYDRRRLVITQHTRRGILQGGLGDVSLLPWGDETQPGRVVAVAGMGYPGTFDITGLRRLVSGLILAISALPNVRTLCTVLIGSGEGALTIREAVNGLVQGIGDAADEIAAREELVFNAPLQRLLIVERDRQRAHEIREALRAKLAADRGRSRAPVALELSGRLRTAPGRAISVEDSLALLLDSAIATASGPADSRERRALSALIEGMAANEATRSLAQKRLEEEGEREAAPSRLPRFRVVRRESEHPNADIPVRISFWDDGQVMKAAAIHQAATVPERLISVGRDVVDDLIEKMTDPPAEEIAGLSDLLYQLLIPAEFGAALASGPFVFEVDRALARIHWEMLASDAEADRRSEPLAVRARFARQLRTTYSPSPMSPRRPGERLRALVIGDPGDPDRGDDLPGAQSEALRVKELLEGSDNVVVEARIGAPNKPRTGPLRDVKPADRLEVLSLLLGGGFDLVHYAGHGDFDPERPNRVGWLFARGLLTPGEIGRIARVPSVIVSNACLSARTSQALAGGRRADEVRSEAGLLPSLADEFFHLGVRNYVGTAWEVNDVGAGLFAETFYGALLSGDSFGEAVRLARWELWRHQAIYGALWAAYQHYGDPTSDARLTRS